MQEVMFMAKSEKDKLRINVRIWAQNYKNLKEICKDRSITLTTAINMAIEDILSVYYPRSEQQMYRTFLQENDSKKFTND